MRRVPALGWIAAIGIALIGLALARLIPSCASAAPSGWTGYAPLSEVASHCDGRNLVWLRWLSALGGVIVGVLILVAAARRSRREGSKQPVGRFGVAALIVFLGSVLLALLIPAMQLVGIRSVIYGPGIPSPTDYLIPIRLAAVAVGGLVTILLLAIQAARRPRIDPAAA